LFLFEEDGSVTLLAENTTSSAQNGGGGSGPSPNDAYLEYTNTNADAGTYYVAVSAFNNDPNDNPDPLDGTFDNGSTGSVGGGDYVLNISIGNPAADLGAFVISAATLLANDSDPDGDPLTIISVDNAVNASVLELTPSGDVLFKPDSEFAASFEYTISDGQGGESTAIAAINGNMVLRTPGDVGLTGSSGNDLFTGGDGRDDFTFGPGTGADADTITDFTVDIDSLALVGGLALDTVTPMENHANGTVVNFDTGDSVLLVGVTDVADVGDLFLP